MPSESQEEHSSAKANLAEWIGLLAGPVAWFLHFQINYALVPWACSNHKLFVLPLVGALFFAIALGGALLSWRNLRQSKRNAPQDETESQPARGRFLSLIGIMSGALFALIIVAQVIATFIISPCLQ